jgi:uncharacterized OsmC-like protein
MLEVSVDHLGSVQFEVKTRGHSVVSDQPESNGGFDEGMTPPELLLASLGSCAGFYAVDYLKRQNLVVEGLKVKVTADKAKNPARLDDFKIEVDIPTGLSEAHRKGVEEAVHRCLIHNTLLHPPKISLDVKIAAVVEG